MNSLPGLITRQSCRLSMKPAGWTSPFSWRRDGADLATLIQPLDRTPVRLIIGPSLELTFEEIKVATGTLYAAIFRVPDGVAAARDERGSRSAQETFWALPADWMFRQIMSEYFRDQTSDRMIAAPVERILTPLAVQGKGPHELAAV
jgi:hypothetical protein